MGSDVAAEGSPREQARAGGLDAGEFRRMVRARHPGFVEAVLADARVTSQNRGASLQGASRWRLALEAIGLVVRSDGFLAQVLYRSKARLQRAAVPLLPRLLHRLAIATSGLYIGDPVVVHPGVDLGQGQIVIDGIVEVHPNATILPFVTIGLRPPSLIGPAIGPGARIGSGAKVLGPVEIGRDAEVGANAVVLEDVPEGATVAGVPARPC